MDPTTTTTDSECDFIKKIPSWMIRNSPMHCMEVGHFGKDAAAAAAAATADAMEHALPCSDLHHLRVGKTAEQSCSVCLKNFEEGDYIWSMPCSHTFHQLCILGDRSCRVCHPAAPPSTEEKPEAPRTVN
ncbi:hypothetical protein OsI_35080 [Oryza sativa Indica Group]|uniref:RING-type domain-containing protein n=2 Tax=Oryza TaxID=4527 RepID=A0A0E0J6H5_ORYNI|nr:hypothetical protein OsI_35080 [Oryza sativa Indica Group]